MADADPVTLVHISIDFTEMCYIFLFVILSLKQKMIETDSGKRLRGEKDLLHEKCRKDWRGVTLIVEGGVK